MRKECTYESIFPATERTINVRTYVESDEDVVSAVVAAGHDEVEHCIPPYRLFVENGTPCLFWRGCRPAPPIESTQASVQQDMKLQK